MAYSIIASGGTLYRMSTSGVCTALTLPSTDDSISTTLPARMAVIGRQIVVVNGPKRSLTVDPFGIVRPMQLRPPSTAPSLSTSGTGTLSGNFQVKYTFAVKDARTGNILLESDYSPESATTGTIANKTIAVTVGTSTDSQVNLRRVYRTTTGPGDTYFHWLDIEGNTSLIATDDLSDASLELFAASIEVGSAPGMLFGTRMTLIRSWKNRLWGVGDENIEQLRYSGNGIVYGWPAAYGLDVPPLGQDEFGITGLLPRRDMLVVGRRNMLHKVLHNGTNSDGTPNFELVQMFEGKGIWAPDTCITHNDVGYFLGEDGWYSVDGDGVHCLSDDTGVRKWFVNDQYFNLAQFPNAFAKYNRAYNGIEVHLASAGSTAIDRWFFYDIKRGQFYGPHKTDAFTPTAAAQLYDADSRGYPAFGSTGGFVSGGNSSTFRDWTTAISMDILSKLHDGQTPNVEKLWKMVTLLNRSQTAAGTFKAIMRLGGLRDIINSTSALVTKTFSLDARKDQGVTPNPGHSRFMQVQITDTTDNQGCEVYGYEAPFHEIGSRTKVS